MALDGPPATFSGLGHNHKGIIRSNHEIINPELDGHQSGIPEFRGQHTQLPAKLFQPYLTVQYPLFPIPSARNGIANKRSIQPRRPWQVSSIPSSPPSLPVAAWGWRRCLVRPRPQQSGESAWEDMETGIEPAWTVSGEAIDSARSRSRCTTGE